MFFAADSFHFTGLKYFRDLTERYFILQNLIFNTLNAEIFGATKIIGLLGLICFDKLSSACYLCVCFDSFVDYVANRKLHQFVSGEKFDFDVIFNLVYFP